MNWLMQIHVSKDNEFGQERLNLISYGSCSDHHFTEMNVSPVPCSPQTMTFFCTCISVIAE